MDGAEPQALRGEAWPACPDCGKRRLATCPVCHTASTEFPLADPEFLGSPQAPAQANDRPGPVCGCGSGSCGGDPARGNPSEGDALGDPAADPEFEDLPDPGPAPEVPSAAGPALICSTCDEPFRPQFARRCVWCGHEFPDGFGVDVVPGEPPEELSVRLIVVLLALVALGIGAMVYFMTLFPAE